MSKIYFVGGGPSAPATTVAGLPLESGVNYLLTDGTRAMSGNLVPASSGAYPIGLYGGATFSSGCFDNKLTVAGIELFSAGVIGASQLHILDYHTQDFGYLRLSEYRGNPLNIKVRDARVSFGSAGTMTWFSGALPSTTFDVNFSRKFSGVMRVGTTSSNSSGGFMAQSGQFPSGIVLIAPNGSGWLISVDSNNNITTTGPLLV